MLNQADTDYLSGKVLATLRQGQPKQILLAVGAPTELLDAISNDFNTAALFTEEVLRRCIADRWNHRPCWLLVLFKLFPAEPRSEELAERLKDPPKYEDQTKARVLQNDSPFLNRELLRSRMMLLAVDRPARPILLVSGIDQKGKSYSWYFIHHLFLTNNVDFIPFRVRFREDDGLLWGPEQLAKEILMGMGVDVDQLSPSFLVKDTNNLRWEQDLAGRVLAKRALGKRYWIILDHFFGATLRTETAKFIDALARRIADSADLAQSFRLILLHFKRAELTVESRQVDEEEVAPVTETDVKEATREIYGRYKGDEQDDVTVQRTVASILDGMPDTKDLELLNERLQKLIDSVRG